LPNFVDAIRTKLQGRTRSERDRILARIQLVCAELRRQNETNPKRDRYLARFVEATEANGGIVTPAMQADYLDSLGTDDVTIPNSDFDDPEFDDLEPEEIEEPV